MEISGSYAWLTDVASTLGDRFGNRLTLMRDGDSVRWSFDGHAAVVSLRPEGTIDATFVEPATFDAAGGTPVRCFYRRSGHAAYTLTQVGCSRMVADMADFFGGVREPQFTFAGAAE
jgi:hypothetical protein